MASQTKILVDDLGEIVLHRRKRVKNVRLRVDNGGVVHLTLPWWVGKSFGLQFVEKQKAWLIDQKNSLTTDIVSGMQAGNAFTLQIKREDRTNIKSKLDNQIFTLTLPLGTKIDEVNVRKHIIKALNKRSEQKISPRIEDLAKERGFKYKNVEYRALRSRWGSCSSAKEIILNSYLVQLPDRLVDYVIIHELSHTKHLHHGKDFWDELKAILPDYKELKKELKSYSPRLIDTRS